MAQQIPDNVFRAILEMIDIGITIINLKTYEVIYLNRYLIDSFGDVTGQICWKALQGLEEGPCEFCQLDKLLDTNGLPCGPYIWENFNPVTKRWYKLIDQAIPWYNKELVRLEIAIDITKTKQDEATISRLHKLESLGTLAGGIAHDFNNLLMGIMGYISINLNEVSPSVRKNLEQALKSCENAAKLTKKIITFSQGGDPVKRKLNLIKFIKNTVEMVLSGLKYELYLPKSCIDIEGDLDQLIQALTNILINAREYNPENDQPIIIKVETIQQGEKHYVKISIQDHGMGIKPEIIPKIFEPYFSTKDMGSIKGQGLGLSLSQSIISKHGGYIDVTSEKGKTIFNVYLPYQPSFKKILILDDDPIVGTITLEMIKTCGYKANLFEEGEKAIEAYQQSLDENQPFDILIVDFILPGHQNGLQVMEKIKSINPNAKGILITGNILELSEKTNLQQTFEAVLEKPFRMEVLISKIKEIA